MKTLLLVRLVAQAPGRPLFYWGARPATIVTHAAAGEGTAARVTEIWSDRRYLDMDAFADDKENEQAA